MDQSEREDYFQLVMGRRGVAQKVEDPDIIEREGIKKEKEMKGQLVQEELALFWLVSENSYRLLKGDSYQEANLD